jgi:hypothetical protein
VTIRCASWISWVPGADSITLFDDRDGSYHALNASASAIWTALGEGKQPDEIREAIAATHRRQATAVRKDVDEFVAVALGKGFLVSE